MELFAEQTILTVSHLTGLVKELLEDNLYQVWVTGELSNLSRPSSGHIYFTLKDENATLRCVMFRSSANGLKFRLEEGQSLILRGRVTVYGQRGEYQLVVEYAEPQGTGALQAAFMQLKSRLSEEGLFDLQHKKRFPSIPEKVALITSISGAVVHDVLNVLGRRNCGVELLIYPVRVQGEGAAKDIATAIRDLNRYMVADVIILARGGGSLEDLWAFNEEIVARALFQSDIPVISAVGHETDWTISDFVADLRAPTPSAAAELVTAARGELEQQVSEQYRILKNLVTTYIKQQLLRLEGLNQALQSPDRLLGHLSQRCDDLQVRVELSLYNYLNIRSEQIRAMEGRLLAESPAFYIRQQQQEQMILGGKLEHCIKDLLVGYGRKLGELTAKLHGVSPVETLARGYAVAQKVSDSKIIKDVDELKKGERILLKFHKGGATCTVEDIHRDSGVNATT